MAKMRTKRPSVLVVDDDELLSDLLGEVLGDAGFVVFTASSVRGALEAATRNDIDVVLTGLSLRRSSGFELLEHLAAHSPPTPAVLMTAFLDNETEHRAQQLGASAAISKPFRNDQVLAVLRRALEGAHTHSFF
jgi:DNA-binding NtrC family response regulator